MWSIWKNELYSFFASPLGYALIGTFFVLNGLFLWFFDTSFNLINAGFGDVSLFFELNPWLLLLFIPALGMNVFSEEIRTGTLELLYTKPLALSSIVLGKFFALLSLLTLSLLVGVFYLSLLETALYQDHQLDWGVFFGAWIGLWLLAATYIAITLFCSTLIRNQIAAYLSGLFLCLIHFYGWNQIALFTFDYDLYYGIQAIGLQYHYQELSKGVIRAEDISYFIGQNVLFLFAAQLNLKRLKG